MNKKEIQKAFADYSKTNDLKALCRVLRDLLLYMATEAEDGYTVRFTNTLPSIVELLNSLDLKEDK